MGVKHAPADGEWPNPLREGTKFVREDRYIIVKEGDDPKKCERCRVRSVGGLSAK